MCRIPGCCPVWKLFMAASGAGGGAGGGRFSIRRRISRCCRTALSSHVWICSVGSLCGAGQLLLSRPFVDKAKIKQRYVTGPFAPSVARPSVMRALC